MSLDKPIKLKKKYKPGIFQYCDRWCEKCEYIDECLYYDVNKKFFLSGEKQFDFWDKIEDIVSLTIEDLTLVSRSMGVDLERFSKRFTKHKSKDALSKGYLLYEKSEQYSKIVNDWFDDFARSPSTFDNDDLKEKISIKELTVSMQRLSTAIEYIRWYQDFISKKLGKALASKHKFKDGFHKGFAKLVLVALDKSIESWKSIKEHVPGTSDKVSNQILLLEKLRDEVENEFPNARSFTRDGLDD